MSVIYTTIKSTRISSITSTPTTSTSTVRTYYSLALPLHE